MTIHFRKDSPSGVTPPNPDGPRDIVAHITKHRGMKTAYTSVSENKDCIKHFTGDLYAAESDDITKDGHEFITHSRLVHVLKQTIQTKQKAEKVTASRALQYALRAKEAVVDWQFRLEALDRNERISWCCKHSQKYFKRI